MTTEEQTLSAMISDALVRLASGVATLTIATQHARLKVLSQPRRIGQRQVGKHLLPLHVIPRRSHVIVPANDALNGIANQIHVDWCRQTESVH